MKKVSNRSLWMLTVLFSLGWSVACTSDSNKNEKTVDEVVSRLKSYQAKPGKLTIKGAFKQFDSLKITLTNPQIEDYSKSWKVTGAEFEILVDSVVQHSLVNISVYPLGRQGGVLFDTDLAPIPLWVEDGQTYTLSLEKLKSPQSSFPNYFGISRGINEEQDSFSDLYDRLIVALDKFSNQIAMSVVLGTQTESGKSKKKWPEIQQEVKEAYLREYNTNAATLYLAFTKNDHRQYRENYRKILNHVSQDVQNSKYGIDLYNRLETIENPPSRFDIEKYLQAIDYQMHPFSSEAYDDKKQWLLVFWNSKKEEDQQFVKSIQDEYSGESNPDLQVLFFNLDARMSRWRLTTSQLSLEDSYFIRAGQRELLVHDWYLTNTPRIVLIEPDGKVVQDDVQLQQVSNFLKP